MCPFQQHGLWAKDDDLSVYTSFSWKLVTTSPEIVWQTSNDIPIKITTRLLLMNHNDGQNVQWTLGNVIVRQDPESLMRIAIDDC
jgi:hypothetical protein